MLNALAGPFAAMVAYRQFIVYKLIPSSTRPGKMDKMPCDFRTGQIVSAHDAQYWTDARTAFAAALNFGQGYGLAFVFTDADPFWFLDIDNCLEPSGQWSQLAAGLCGALQGAAVEVSQSGRGLHIFGSGKLPPHGCKNSALGLELYHSLRFVALTGTGVIGNAATDLSHIMPTIIGQYFPHSGAAEDGGDWSDGPVEDWRGPTDDEELLRRALRSYSASAAFGGKASFADLWNANIDVLSRVFPDEQRPYDCSSADAALAQHLAFWTGNDCERIQRLMMKSALIRDKWEREDYLRRTIGKAVSRQSEVLTDRVIEAPAGIAVPIDPPSADDKVPEATVWNDSPYLSVVQQIAIFRGCVYIRDQHKILIPGGVMVKPEQFRVMFGGHVFQLDHANEKTTDNAFDAFTQSRGMRCPKVDGVCFRPELKGGAIIERNGQKFVNTYWPVQIDRKLGDATPFLTHMAKLIPNERDRLIALSYMAFCVQHQGYKSQWALFIQGIEGNGKTLLTRCVAEAVGRRYVHWPKASKLSKEFNSWMVGKVFYGVEDVYIPGSKLEVWEELKPMITGGDGLEIEGKGVDQISADICGNFMLNSNHKGALPKTAKDRRICPIFTAQQAAGDLTRDGMDGDYFPRLYEWLRADGYAIVSELLHTFPIPREYNPALDCQRAPDTSSTFDAIETNAGSIEQEIQEAVAQGVPGFCGGWISSIQLERLLERIGAIRRISHHARREMLRDMGYEAHPALTDGRVNNNVLPDNGKPRLFILRTVADYHIKGAAEAGHAYQSANNRAFSPAT